MKDKIIKVRVTSYQFNVIARAAAERSIPTSTMIRWIAVQDAVDFLQERDIDLREINV
jgi:hypothetical protein